LVWANCDPIVVSQKELYCSCHSGLDPESIVFPSGFPPEFTPYPIRGGNDKSRIIVRKC